MIRNKKRLSVRKIARRIHLWLGITVGVIFTLLCLSGAALVYYTEIDVYLNPEINVQTHSPFNFDAAINTLRESYPSKKGPWRIEVTPTHGAIPARYYNPPETQGHGFSPMMVWLSADGKTILRKNYWGDYLVTWLYNLHYTLLMGTTGTIIIGYLGLASMLIIISGIIAWWPKKGAWLTSLKFKRRKVLLGQLYDWHKLIGLIQFIPLLILTVSGIMLALPTQTNTLLQSTIGQVASPVALKETHPLETMININEAVKIAKKALPNARLAWIQTPSTTTGYYRLRMQTSSDASSRFPHSYVDIDPNTGDIENLFDLNKQNSSTHFKNWLHPIHNGSFGGTIMRVCWLIAGFSALLLFILGMSRWHLRTSKNRKH